MVTRSPPVNRTVDEGMTAAFNNDYVAWRRLLQRANMVRLRILRNLAKDGSGAAVVMLGEKPRVENAKRCGECAGCQVMRMEKACL